MARGWRSAFGVVLAVVVLAPLIGPGGASAQVDPDPWAAAEISPNPEIAEACGVDLTLVLDASGSIQTADAVDDVREAAGQFLNALADTDSRARVIQFASLTEELAPSTLITRQSVAPGGVHGEATTGYYNPKPQRPDGVTIFQYDGSGNPAAKSNWNERNGSNQYTNWHGSLKQVGERTDDLVVYITDGAASAYTFDQAEDPFGLESPPDVGVGTDRGEAEAVSAARTLEAANAIKDAGTRMLAVGVGDATSSASLQDRLAAISGPQVVTDLGSVDGINDVDVAIVEDFEDLAQFLRSVVLELCSPSLTITKLSQTPDSAAYTPAGGWSMTVTPSVDPASAGFSWILPDTAPATSKTLVSGEAGTVQFQWEPGTGATSSARVTESLAGKDDAIPGRPSGVDWECGFLDEFGNTRTASGELVATGPDSWGFDLDPIFSEVVTCTVWNSFDFQPSISLTKENSPTSFRGDLTPAARATSYFEVTNTGNTDLRGVDVLDDQCNPEPLVDGSGNNVGDANQNGILEPFATSGEVWQFECDKPIRGDSDEPGGVTITNNATAIGVDPAGEVVTADADADVVAWSPEIEVEKTVRLGSDPTVAGSEAVEVIDSGEVTYTYDVTNTGNAPLGSVEVVDDHAGLCEGPFDTPVSGDTNGNGILEPGGAETWRFVCGPVTVTESFVNTATASGVPLDPLDSNNPFPDPNPAVTDRDTAAVQVSSADIELSKSADPILIVLDEDGTPEPVTYTYSVVNTGTSFLRRPGAESGGPEGTDPTDPGWIVDDTCGPVTYTGGDDNGDDLIEPSRGETWVFQCTATVVETTTNVADIEAQPTDAAGDPIQGADLVGNTAAALVEVLVPDIIVEKIRLHGVVSDQDVEPAFGPDSDAVIPAEYLYDVGNIGTIPLVIEGPPGAPAEGVLPSDDLCDPLEYVGGDNDGNGLLDPFEVFTYSCGRPLDREVDGNTPPVTGDESGVVRNTVEVEGIPIWEGTQYPDRRVTDSDVASVQVIEPGIEIEKTASRAVAEPGTEVTYTYVVSNTGDVGLVVDGPFDDRCAPLVYQGGDDGNGILAGANSGAPEAWTYTCTRAVFDADGDGVAVNNVIVGGWDPLGNLYTAEDTAEVEVIRPAIDLVKSVDKTLVPVGTEVTYTFEVRNVGSSPLPADDALANLLTVDFAVPVAPECLVPRFLGGDDNGNDLLERDPAEVWVYECSSTVTELQVDIAVATGLGGTEIDPDDPVRVFDRDSAAVQVFSPAIDVVKTADPTELVGGGQVTYTYEVTNPGDVPLAGVASSILDDTCSPVTYVGGDEDGDGLLDTPISIFEDGLDETWVFTCATTVTEDTTNVVVVGGTPTDPGGEPLCGPGVRASRVAEPCDVADADQATVVVLAPASLTIAKQTVAPTNTSFAFDLDGVPFSLGDGEQRTFVDLGPGEYTIREDPTETWTLDQVVCLGTATPPTVDEDAGTATVELAAGEDAVCTFSNTFVEVLPETGAPIDLHFAVGLVLLLGGTTIVGLTGRRRGEV